MKKIIMLILLLFLGINTYAQNTSKQDSSVIKAEKEKLIRTMRQTIALLVDSDLIETVRAKTNNPEEISSYIEGMAMDILNKNGIATMKESEDLLKKYKDDVDVQPFDDMLKILAGVTQKELYALKVEKINNATKKSTEAIFDSEVELNKAMQRYITKIRKLDFFNYYNYDVHDRHKVDINMDGIEDYVILFSMINRGGGNLSPLDLVVFFGDGFRYDAVADYSTVNIEIVSIKGSIINLKKMEYQDSDPNCCPSLETHLSIRLRNNIFIDESNGIDLSEFSTAIKREEADTYISPEMDLAGNQKAFYNDSETQEIETQAILGNENNTLSHEFEQMVSNIRDIYHNQSNRIELYVQFGEANILKRVNTMKNISEHECAFHIIRNDKNKIIFICKMPFSYTGDTYQTTEMFFDDNGELKGVDFKYSASEGILAQCAAYITIQCLFNNRQKIYYNEILRNMDDKPLLQTESSEEELNNQLIWHTNDFLRQLKFIK